MKRPSREAVAEVAASLLLVTLLLVFYYGSPGPVLAFGLGLLAAIATGLLVPLLVFELQSPSFVVWPAEDKWDGVSRWKFIHVVVRNTAGSFMGGGAAGSLRGEIRVDGQEKAYTPKWVARSEPIDIQYLPPLPTGQPTPAGYVVLTRIDPGLIEEAKILTVNPQEEHILDIAVKVKDDPRCFIHEPENYSDLDHKRNPFDVGDHRISLTLKWGSNSDGPFEFILANGPGTNPDSLSLKRAREDDPKTQPPSKR
jgi:hypothetical protein